VKRGQEEAQHMTLIALAREHERPDPAAEQGGADVLFLVVRERDCLNRKQRARRGLEADASESSAEPPNQRAQSVPETIALAVLHGQRRHRGSHVGNGRRAVMDE